MTAEKACNASSALASRSYQPLRQRRRHVSDVSKSHPSLVRQRPTLAGYVMGHFEGLGSPMSRGMYLYPRARVRCCTVSLIGLHAPCREIIYGTMRFVFDWQASQANYLQHDMPPLTVASSGKTARAILQVHDWWLPNSA